MAKTKMWVCLFSVAEGAKDFPLESTLQIVAKKSLKVRTKTLANGQVVRAEELRPPTKKQPFWLVDLVHIRLSNGPARANVALPVVGFDMDTDDGFGEETAMLYCPENRWLILQQNGTGVRVRALESYLAQFSPAGAGCSLQPALDPDIQGKLYRANHMTSLTVTVAPNLITSNLRDRGLAVGGALDLAAEAHALKIEIKLSVGKSKASLNRGLVRTIIDQALGMRAGNPKAVTQAKVKAKNTDDPESKSEMLDLLTPAMKMEFEQTVDADRRLPREGRYAALMSAYATWKRALLPS